MNFIDIEYLKAGTDKQKLCYRILKEINVLDVLRDYNPILVGTIPIAIDIDESDIDIVCCAENLPEIRDVIRLHYSTYHMFLDRLRDVYVANFEYSGLPIEIYAESRPTLDQNGYRHMVVEDRIMKLAGDGFRQKIIRLKEQGFKTEPAFGELLNLENPYLDLLEFELLTDDELKLLIKNKHVPQ